MDQNKKKLSELAGKDVTTFFITICRSNNLLEVGMGKKKAMTMTATTTKTTITKTTTTAKKQ